MDFNLFIERLKQFAKKPAMRLILLPLIYLLYGIVFGIKLGKFNLLGTVVLFVFTVLLQLLEQYFFISQLKKGHIKWSPIFPILLATGGLLLLMLLMTNVVFIILATMYVISVLLIHGFFRLKGSVYYIVLQTFLKSVVLTVLSSFMQIHFVSYQLLIQIIPVALALSVYFVAVEKIDILKYHNYETPTVLLNGTLVMGLIGVAFSPIFIGKLHFNQLVMLILWGVLILATGVYLFKGDDAKNKSVIATLYSVIMVLYCLM